MRRPPADRPPLLWHFALQLQCWALGLLALVLVRRGMLTLRDLDGAIALERFTWMSVGFDLGVVALGAALALIGARRAGRAGLGGAGLALIVEGSALAFLDLQFASTIVR